MSALLTTRTTCRACRGELRETLDLGEHHLSGFLPPGRDFGPKAPLVLMICTRCQLLQLRDTVDRDRLYKTYFYRSGINESMRHALQDITRQAEALAQVQPGDVVLDIGANDGTLLSFYDTHGTIRVACEPSDTMQLDLIKKQTLGAVTHRIHGYFTRHAYENHVAVKAKVITAIAMLYDLEDPGQFLQDVMHCLAPDGIFIVQMSYLGALVENGGYDVVCHEHLEIWSTLALEPLLRTHGLSIHRVEYNAVNGGSVRYVITHTDAPAALVARVSADNDRWKLQRTHEDNYEHLRLDALWERVENHRYLLLGMLYHLTAHCGKEIIGLGASTKANTMYQYCGIGTDLIRSIVDRDPAKEGFFTPTGQKIGLEQTTTRSEPDSHYVYLVNIWQFLPMLKERYTDFLAGGGHFLVPFPEPYLYPPNPGVAW